MTIKKEIDTWQELVDMCWSGASDTLRQAEKVGAENEVLEYLEQIFSDEEPTETELNDYIWFQLADDLGLYEREEEDEDEEEDISF